MIILASILPLIYLFHHFHFLIDDEFSMNDKTPKIKKSFMLL